MDETKPDLRKKAELLLGKSSTQLASMTHESIEAMLYEFQVYQIELELQNEELKHAQQALISERDRYAELYNALPVGYLKLDEAGVIQAANPAAARLLGAVPATPATLIQQKLGRFINPLDQEAYYLFIQATLSQRCEQTVILRMNQGNKSPLPSHCQGLKHFDCAPETCVDASNFTHLECRSAFKFNKNNAPMLCVSLLDVTDTINSQETIICLNKKLEQKIFQQTHALNEINQALVSQLNQLEVYKQHVQEREAMLNAIFNAAAEGIITTYLSGDIVYINDTVESIFGYSKAELAKTNIFQLMPASERENHARYLMNSSDSAFSEVISKVREVHGIRKDGSTVPLDISIARFSIDNTRYITSIVRDITQRKIQEQRDQEHLDELSHVTRLGLLGEMASGIAHEVNQPLTAIANYSQACLNLMQNGDADPAQLAGILQKTNQQALKAGQIIHRMRDFVKSRKIHHSTVEINALILDAISLSESFIKTNGVTLQLQLADALPTLCIDSIQIEQVILNLIKNSIDALLNLPPLTARRLSVQTALNSKGEIEIRIKDNGQGIVASEQHKILTPFYTTKAEGMGMGLSICRSIIEAHGGVLRFNSQPGKGSTFYFTLAVQEQNHGN